LLQVNDTTTPVVERDAAGAHDAAAIPDTGQHGGHLGALLLLALTIASGATLRIVFSPLQELAKGELSLTDLQLSLVQGLAASIPIAILAIPIGRLVDRSNRVRLLIALAAVSAVGTLMTAIAHDFATLFVARMLAGLGAVCAIPVAISIAADLSAIERRGRAILLLSTGQAIGVAAGFALAGALIGAIGVGPDGWFGMTAWRSVHILFGVAALLCVVPLLLLAEPARRELGNIVHPPFGVVLRELWIRRAFLIPLFIGQISVVMADVAAGIWAAPVLTRDHGLTPEQFGAWMGLAVLVPGIAGSIIGGIAADLGQRSSRRGGILYGAVIASVVAIPAALFPLAPGLAGFASVLGLFLLCGAMTGLITATVIATIIPNELRGICLGMFVVVSSVIGMGIAPTVVTLVSAALGGESHLAAALAGTGVVISVASLLAFVLAAMRLPLPERAR
jgi:MFS family permease